MIDFKNNPLTHKATILFDTGEQYYFNVWNGTPQRPKKVIDNFRRLGSKQQRIQVLGEEASLSTSVGIIADADIESTETLNDLVGSRFTLTYYGGKIYQNCILFDVKIAFTEADYGGISNTVAQVMLSYMVDGDDDE